MTTKLYALALGLAGLAFGGGAAANTISLTPVVGNQFQHSVESPCVFSSPSCQNPATFPSTDLPSQGNITSWDVLSPLYTGQTLLDIIGAGNSLLLGLNLNQTNANSPQTLVAFDMRVNGAIVDTLTGPISVPDINNGLGYADYLLGNFSSFTASDTVQFRFAFADANDGPEIVFVLGTPGTAVPEPATLALLGLGLLGACFARRRRS